MYPLSATRTVPAKIQHPDYAKDGVPRSEQVFVGRHKVKELNQKEIDGMRKVCRLAREVLDIAALAAKPGVTTDYIDEVVHKACLERDVSLNIKTHTEEDRMLTSIVLPLTTKLLRLSQVRLHISQRGNMSWYTG